MYEYRKSLKSDVSDELVNTYLLRPLAGLFVRLVYRTSITPNQVTIASTVAGLIAALFYLRGEALWTAIAGLCVTLKDLLDSADGQLARAKQQYSRIGRFLDSIGDFVVDVAVFAAIGWALYSSSGDPWMLVLAFLCLAGITLRVSYHVYYQTSYLHLGERYAINRLTEEITEDDRKGDRFALALQRVFQVIYGWQDRLMVRIDAWGRRGRERPEFLARWYTDAPGLRISGLLGMGTELFLLMLCSVSDQLVLYCFLNLILMNAILLASVLYRRFIFPYRLQLGGSL